MKSKAFNYVGPINNTGYGVASLGYLNALAEQNPNISIVPIGTVPNDIELSPAIKKALANKANPSAPTFCFWHLFDIPNRIQDFSGPKIAFTTFELNELTKEELVDINKYAFVGTASRWGADILSKYISQDKVFIAPHAYKHDPKDVVPTIELRQDFDYWQGLLHPFVIPNNSLYLSIAGKFESRKGYPELITACLEASSIRPIVLVSFCYNPFIPDGFPYSYFISNNFYPVYTNSGLKAYKKNNLLVLLMPPVKNRTDLHRLLAKAHFFISPSKGEGWNLPLFEMMSYGMPSITPLVSAHTEYCNNKNVVPIGTSDKEVANDGLFFKGQGTWAKISWKSILTSIVDATNLEIADINRISNLARQETSNFSWKMSAKIIQNLMNKF